MAKNNPDENSEKPIPGYYRFAKAWYATDEDQEKRTIMVGMYYPDGGATGEFSVSWESFENKLVARLAAYDDAWKVLSSFSNLLKEMAKWDNKNITEEQFAQLLDRQGFTDLTPYKQSRNLHEKPRVFIYQKNKGLKK